MADVALSSSYPLPDADNELKSLAYLANVITNIVITNISQSSVDSSVESFVAIGSTAPAAPTTGRMWLDTSESTYQLKFYTGSAWVAVMAYGATAPGTTQSTLWYDSALKTLRQYDTKESLAGWHPTDEGLLLMTNNSGSAVTAGQVVIREETVTAARQFDLITPMEEKSLRVVGVAAEDIAAGAAGVIATFGYTGYVTIDVIETTHTVAVNDLLVQEATGGSAHSVGPAPVGIVIGGNEGRSFGLPHGAFARALTVASGGQVTAKMLGQIGTGCTRLFDGTATALTDDSAWHDLDLSGELLTSKHGPMLEVIFRIDASYNAAAAASDGSIEISPNRTDSVCYWYGESTGAIEHAVSDNRVYCQTASNNADGMDKLGNYVQYRVTSPTADWVRRTFRVMGYVY